MNGKKLLLYVFSLATLFLMGCEKRTNKFVPGEIWPDNNGIHINAHGGGILFDANAKKYYWFGEHKTEGKEGNLANVGVHCYSSTDLYNWTDEGVALEVMPEGSGSDIEKGCILERPKVIYNQNTGKYVMWFHLEPKGAGYLGAKSGVAISDNITGPYKFLKSLRPNAGYWPMNYPDSMKNFQSKAKGITFSGGDLPEPTASLNIVGRDFEGGQMARDMSLFVDEDGKAYHLYSSEENSTLHIALLNEEYTDYTGSYKRIFPDRFMEAPAMFKKDGKYYLIMSGCTGWKPNAGRSAVADSIFGEWTELGNPFVGENAELSFNSQSTFVLPVQGKKDTYIYLGDRWTPDNAIDGRYIWLPIQFEKDKFIIEWMDEWRLN